MATGDYRATLEAWKAIPSYSGYQASDWGRIRSFWKQVNRASGEGKGYRSFISTDARVLKPRTDAKGRLQVNVRRDSGVIHTRPVHQLILETFIGPCPPGMVACHDPDPTPSNNRLTNLRWDTQKENIADAGRLGTKKVMLPDQVAEIIRLDREGITRSEIAARFDVHTSSVGKVLTRNGIHSQRLYRPPSILSAEDLTLAIKLAGEGMLHREIARTIGVSRPTITRWLSRSSKLI